MKKIHVHIGAEKCASSLIEQMYLGHPSLVDFLAGQGIVTLGDLHIHLRQCQPFDKWDAATHGMVRDAHLAPHAEGAATALFATEEGLLGLNHEPGGENLCPARCDFIRQLTEGLDTHLIVFVRRQDKFIESLYNQNVKRLETRPFATYFDALPLTNYEWDRVIDTFKDAFGTEKISAFPYETSVLKTKADGPANVVAAVARAMGLSTAIEIPDNLVVNPSLPAELIPAQLRVNTEMDADTAMKVADILSQEMPKMPGKTLGLLDDAGRAALVERYRESNARLFAEHFTGYDPSEYLRP